MGLFYENGWAGIKDLKLAINYYSKAAKQGFTNAQKNLGILLIEAKGGELDYDQARKLFMIAAKSNNPVAMYNLGHLYNYGLGVPRDDVQAATWYNKAANLGSMSAKNSLALFYAKELGDIPVDKEKAFKLLNISACQGYAVAQNNLGILYSDGTNGLSKDYVKAYAWFSVAFHNGFKEADISRGKLWIN